MALLLVSWAIEGGAGVWFCYHFWMFERWPYHGEAAIFGPGYALVQLYNGFMSSWYHVYSPHRHFFALTQGQVAWFFVALYAAFHIVAFARGLLLPAVERHKQGVRRRPSVRERERFERARERLVRARRAVQEAPPLKKPRHWQVRDSPGVRMRWIGRALVIDRGILESVHCSALLAHQLGHAHSLDLVIRALYDCFPPLRWSVFTLVGMPNGLGRIALYPVWMKYWRARVFACDAYAARLGQGAQLIRALDDLKWALDGNTATRGGRWLRETPYIEDRIDRLTRFQASQM